MTARRISTPEAAEACARANELTMVNPCPHASPPHVPTGKYGIFEAHYVPPNPPDVEPPDPLHLDALTPGLSRTEVGIIIVLAFLAGFVCGVRL